MAVEVKSDIINSAGWRYNSVEGAVAQRRFRVSGLGASGIVKSGDVFGEAVRAVCKKARPGSPYPNEPTLIAVDYSVEPMANAKNACWVIVGYRDRGPRVRVNGNLMRESTKFDFEGKPLKVVYTPPAPRNSKGLELQEVSELPLFTVSANISLDWLDCVKMPGEYVRKYLGKINKTEWQGFAPHTVLCTNVGARSLVDGALTPRVWQFDMNFSTRFEGPLGMDSWDAALLYIDLHTRRIPPDIDPKKDGWPEKTSGNGWRRVQLQGEADFNDITFNDVRLPELIG